VDQLRIGFVLNYFMRLLSAIIGIAPTLAECAASIAVDALNQLDAVE
jgi:hypothetical protein